MGGAPGEESPNPNQIIEAISPDGYVVGLHRHDGHALDNVRLATL
jgi:hypothetical protein